MMPSVIGPVCRQCGCSHEDPCECECGCAWAEPDLCTACAERAVPDLSPVEAAAVRRGACAAVRESPLADPETLLPPGAGLSELMERIDG